jgi:hypothetical protein
VDLCEFVLGFFVVFEAAVVEPRRGGTGCEVDEEFVQVEGTVPVTTGRQAGGRTGRQADPCKIT